MEFISIFESNCLPNNANYHPAWKMFPVSFSGSANTIARTNVSIHYFLRLISFKQTISLLKFCSEMVQDMV